MTDALSDRFRTDRVAEGREGARTVNNDDFPGPLRHFLTRLDELRSENTVDMDRVGRLLVDLAADEDYLGPLIAEIPSESAGGRWLVKPERGPRLVLFHRPEGASTDLDDAAARIDASVRFWRNWLARARIPDLWVPANQRTLCDVLILVNQSADAVVSSDVVVHGWVRWGSGLGESA